MSEPILAPEEIAALMAEVDSGEQTEAIFATLPPIIQPADVKSFQFDGRDDESPERYPMFVNLQERLVEMLDEQWDELFRRDISVQVSSLENLLYRDIISVDAPQVYFVFEAEGYGRILISFDTALIVAFVDAMLGGDGEASGNPQTLSAVEMKLANRIGDKISKTLSDLWGPVHPLEFSLERLDYDPQFLAVTGAMEKCFSTFFDIKLNDELTGQMGIYYPRPFLEPLMDILRVTVSDDTVENDDEWTGNLLDRLSLTQASLRLELGRCQINIGSFLAMKPGDFLPLSTRTTDPCSLWIEDIPLFEARPGEKNGVLAAEIIQPVQHGG
ncbi:flagellar motor switch protein FliM [Mariprofundus erugo]|uniref:Flagellar motor switch protein FliM n=1 Tax=Mariprofundus erugo TaxID=2528639 RepID=A0A5R9GP52_9PROT|nr:FliM/FliN family flagellar motor switch protein [Mariprofundus erugo]TLS66709.1 flagellar motor switch protein FliM [Mariprofundus erugo]TLS78431.1 flagellar motor switch protein FliM [Mariprofundus erugo]